MSLLDDDSAIIKRNNENSNSKKSGRKAKKSGLNRFANSLNKYKHLSEEHKKKSTTDRPKQKILETEAKKESPSKETLVTVTKSVPSSKDQSTEEQTARSEVKISKPLVKKNEPLVAEAPIEYNSPKELEYRLDNNKSTDKSTLEYRLDNNKSTDKNTLEYELDNNKTTEGVQKGLHIGVQIEPNFPLVRMIGGQKRQLLNLLFEDCKAQGSLITGKLLNENLSRALDVKPSTLKTLVYRLSKDGFIERLPGKRGRGGWIQITIPKPVYNQLLSIDSYSTVEMLSQNIEYKMSTQRSTEKSTNPPSSSSGDLIINTTTTRKLPDDWQIVQIPQNLKDIGISIAHILQIASDGNLTPDETQDSLEAFSYDLEKGSVNAKFGPLRLLLGVLRKQKVPYVSQALIEEERRQLKEYKKLREEGEALKKQQAEFGLVQKFESWWDGLTQEEKNQASPPSNFVSEGSDMQKKIARGNFLNDPSIADC